MVPRIPPAVLSRSTSIVSCILLAWFLPLLANAYVIIPSDAFQVTYAANLNKGDSVINISNTGSQDDTVSANNICVNVYTFDPAEEMVSCCACLITPNALVSLSVQGDLISNTLSPATPTSVVIKFIATDAGHDNLSICSPGSVTSSQLASGLRGWSTTLHALPGTSGAYGLTEVDFQQSRLSGPELSHLTQFCGFIYSNGSGFGICKSCRANGLAGGKQ